MVLLVVSQVLLSGSKSLSQVLARWALHFSNRKEILTFHFPSASYFSHFSFLNWQEKTLLLKGSCQAPLDNLYIFRSTDL